jgi:hypothetical protein
VETLHLCPASPPRGGLTGLTGVTTRPAGHPKRRGYHQLIERQLHLITGGRALHLLVVGPPQRASVERADAVRRSRLGNIHGPSCLLEERHPASS